MSVAIVGDGPAGLSAALFLSKNGMDVTVYGQDKTAMHYARLFNYLGLPGITGTEFQRIASEQVSSFGARFVRKEATSIEVSADGFHVITEDGQRSPSRYLILAEGKALKLADSIGLQRTDLGADVDRAGRSAVERLYVVGRGTRIARSQAIISAGEGAAAALDILSAEKGQDFVDYDTVD